MAIDEPIKRRTPVGNNSESAKTKMGQKMVSVHQRLSLLHSSGSRHGDNDEDFEPTDEDLAIVVGQKTMEIDDRDYRYCKFDYVPSRQVIRPEIIENGQEKRQSFRYKHGAAKTSTGLTKTYKRKRGIPAGSKYAKSKMEQKPAFFHSSRSSSSDSRSDTDDDFDPSDENANFETTRKRRELADSKSSKSKTPPLVDRSSNSSEGKNDKDADFQHEVSGDDGRKKYARVKDFYGTAWDRAVKVNAKLPAEGPSFVKLMLKSHVVRVFWLSLPVSFCRNHLPEHDVTIELEDEDGHSYDTNYLAKKTGLSGGWNRFSVQHDLKVGDAVVFQLVRPTRFKVYILREDKFTTTDGALSLLSLDTSKENSISEEYSSAEDITRVSCKASNDDSGNLDSEETADDCIRDSEETADDCIRSPDPDNNFGAMTNIRNFKIIVNGSEIDHKLLPNRLGTAYYKLCCARKAFLHRHLLKQINPMLVAGVIAETVNIAQGIRASPTSSSSLEDFATWKKTLESFELLGMDVGFLRNRVEDLLALTAHSLSRDLLQVAVEECKGYKRVKLEQDGVAEKMRALESKMSSLKAALTEMDVKMNEMMELSMKKMKERAIRQLAAAPW
uniref:Uncharacterized protein n=1 Tax=Avena sativa TaxID=4498 RepID=A0ACD5VEC9_AVESA